MRQYIYIFLFTILPLNLISQSYNNPGGTINTCSGTFYDTGGNGTFGPGENIVTTFCSNNGGGAIVIDFINYDLYPDPSNCYIRVYDGPTNNPGDLIATLTGTNYSAPTYTSTGTCLTFEFVSCNWCGYFPGWVANISCQAPATCTEGDCTSCNELSFESVSPSDNEVCLEGWELLKGKNDVSGPYTVESPGTSFTNCRGTALVADIYHTNNCSSNIPIYNGATNHHDIIDASSGLSDSHQAVPAVPNLSGSNANVMRLGESSAKCFAANAEGMVTNFTITDDFLAYHYLLKFENTGHNDNDRGFCTFQIRDNGGTVLPCGSFQVYENGISNSGENWVYDAGYTNAQSSQNGIWYMDGWNTRIIDVSDYIGQDLTIEVWVADCQQGAHGSWGYFDFECLSGVTPDCSVSPLPVEFYGFKANCENNTSYLEWNTASERDNSHFTVWESNDGLNFRSIGDVLGVGNSTSNSHYSFSINSNTIGTKYYRLSQTDYNGVEKNLSTISYNGCNQKDIDIIVTNENININGNEINQITIFDASGRLVYEKFFNDSEQTTSIESLEKGIYFIAVYQKGVAPQTFKILNN